MTGAKNRTSEILPVAFLILCVILLFSQVLYTGTSLYGSDFLYYFYPVKKFIRYCFSNNTIPLWNPYLFSGSPFISNIQASMFYPLSFLYYIFSPATAYLYSTIMHCMFGVIFMYLFMRSISISQLGSLLSAIIFMFNGYFIGHLYAGHLSFIQTYIWLPLICIFLIRFLNTINFRNTVIAGLILGVQILGGFPQISFYTILAIIVFGMFSLWDLFLSRENKKMIMMVFGLCIIFLIGFALAAIQIFPTLEFTELSTRAGGVSYGFATSDSLHPKELLTFILPEIFGNEIDGTYWRIPEGWHFWETCAYVGIIPFFLIFFKPVKEYPKRLWLFFIILIFLSLFLALGKYNPVYPVIYKLPGFHSFRIPAQIIYLYIFSVAALSGIGITSIESYKIIFSKCSVGFLTLIGVILIIFIVCIHWSRYEFFQEMFNYFAEGSIKKIDFYNLYERTANGIDKAGLIFFAVLLLVLLRRNQNINFRIFSVCLLLLALMDLGEFGWDLIKPCDYSSPPEKQHLADRINKEPSEGRVVALSPFNSNDGLTYRFPSVLGYNPLILETYVHYIQTSQGLPYDNNLVDLLHITYPDSKLLNMLNVNKLVYMDKVLEIKNDIPYVNFASGCMIKDEDKILGFMQSDEFDPKNMVVFDSEYSSIISPCQMNEDIKGSFSVLEYSINKIRINVTVDKPAYLIFSEIYYPGWRARIDGKVTSILCGNYLFRTLSIPDGEHEIILYFISWPFRIGIIISVITLICVIGYLLYRKLF